MLNLIELALLFQSLIMHVMLLLFEHLGPEPLLFLNLLGFLPRNDLLVVGLFGPGLALQLHALPRLGLLRAEPSLSLILQLSSLPIDPCKAGFLGPLNFKSFLLLLAVPFLGPLHLLLMLDLFLVHKI